MLLEANLPGQSPGLTHFKHEFPTKKAGHTNSILHIGVFQAAGGEKKTKSETHRDINMKKCESTEHS